jgi:hypothetical protein
VRPGEVCDGGVRQRAGDGNRPALPLARPLVPLIRAMGQAGNARLRADIMRTRKNEPTDLKAKALVIR